MERVTGIGGIFFKAKADGGAERLRAWYRDHLGIELTEWGGHVFEWRDPDRAGETGATVWSVFAPDSKYLDPSPAPFMVSYRVRDLDAMLAQLRAAGVTLVGEPEAGELGRFAWALDPDGNKLELWEPPPARPSSGPATTESK